MARTYYNLADITFQPIPTHSRFADLTVATFNRLSVLGYAGKRQGSNYWFCKCECGNVIHATAYCLTRSITTSCGCFARERATVSNTKHGWRYSSEYRVYGGAKTRCENPKSSAFHNYGGRGIEFRFNSFEEFLASVGKRPSLNHTLERIDNNGHYEKGNVKWATKEEQARNKRRNVFITIDGQSRCLADWARISSRERHTISKRLKSKQFCSQCAVFAPRRYKCNHLS